MLLKLKQINWAIKIRLAFTFIWVCSQFEVTNEVANYHTYFCYLAESIQMTAIDFLLKIPEKVWKKESWKKAISNTAKWYSDALNMFKYQNSFWKRLTILLTSLGSMSRKVLGKLATFKIGIDLGLSA